LSFTRIPSIEFLFAPGDVGPPARPCAEPGCG
jgi:hypothetical protein